MALFILKNPFGGDDENTMQFFINQSKNNLFRLIDSKETKSQIHYVSNELNKMNLCYSDFEEKYKQVLNNPETDELTKKDYKNHFQIDVLSPISNYIIELKEILNQLTDDLKDIENNEIIKSYSFGIHFKNRFVWTSSKIDFANVMNELKAKFGINKYNEIIDFAKINGFIMQKGPLTVNDIKKKNESSLTNIEKNERKKAIMKYIKYIKLLDK